MANVGTPQHRTPELSPQEHAAVRDGVVHALAESLFVLLPLVVLVVAEMGHGGSFREILCSPEWAFGAAVFAGHAALKLSTSTIRAGNRRLRIRVSAVALILAIVLVGLLVPAMVVLVEILDSPLPGIGLGVAQVVLFVLSWTAFLFTGIAAGFAEG